MKIKLLSLAVLFIAGCGGTHVELHTLGGNKILVPQDRLDKVKPLTWAYNLDVYGYDNDKLWQAYAEACRRDPNLEGKVLGLIERHYEFKRLIRARGGP